MDREYQSRHDSEQEWTSSRSPAAKAAGRATQSDAVDGASGAPAYTKSSLFTARAAPAEAEPALPDAAAPETAALTAPEGEHANEHPASPPPDAVGVSHGDDVDAKERIYGDQHHHAHAAPFEHKRAHAERHQAKRDKYNKPGIKSDKVGKDVAARPGVIQNKKSGRDGVFMLKNATATRYLFVNHGGTNVAEPYDVVEKKDLARHNYKNADHSQDAKGRTKRLLLNPAAPRKLSINGQERVCVLSWIDGMTAAWIPVGDLEGSTASIVSAVKARSNKWDPARVSNDPDALHAKSKRYVIRNDKVGQTTPGDEPHHKPKVLEAGAKGGDNVSHYLSKDLRKPAFDAKGDRIAKNVTRSVAAITMNLPSHDAPPLACDTAEAGQSFFVMRAKTFHRSVAVFANGAHQSSVLQTWVFGHIAMRDANGKLVPDPARRGWIPLRVLAEAAHLETHDIAQRK